MPFYEFSISRLQQLYFLLNLITQIPTNIANKKQPEAMLVYSTSASVGEKLVGPVPAPVELSAATAKRERKKFISLLLVSQVSY
jgi:hypothetical protein